MRLLIGAWKRGWKLPDDMALMGVNNFPFTRHLDPQLSTVQFPYDYLTRRVLERALEVASNDQKFKPFDTVPLEVVIRQSCGGKKRCSKEELQRLVESLQIKLMD